MRKQKYYIVLSDFQRLVLVNCLNEIRNRLIADGKYTDDVDDLLLKVIDAKTKNSKSYIRRRKQWKSTSQTNAQA